MVKWPLVVFLKHIINESIKNKQGLYFYAGENRKISHKYMNNPYKRWQKLFLFCLGISAGTAFCMKWMEGDFWQNGEKFTIIGLEITYTKEKLAAILSGLDEPVKTILRYHISFDFAFMAGVYPGIAALCMMAREKTTKPVLQKILLVFAFLQTVAWGCDIGENILLSHWIKNPVSISDFGTYHIIVIVKWSIALMGAILAMPLAIRRRKRV